MPVAHIRISLHSGSKLVDGGFGHKATVCFRARRVAHRSVLQVVTVADHLTKKADLRVAPFDGRIGLREPSDDREPVTALEFRDGLPPIESAKAMLGRCADRPSARQSDLVN